MRHAIAFLVLALFAASPALAVDGTELFLKNCSECHGEDGNAQTVLGKAMQAHPIHLGAPPPEKVIEHVRTDPKHKPVSDKLSDEELDAIAHALPKAS